MKKSLNAAAAVLLAGALLLAGCVKTPDYDAVTPKVKVDAAHIGELLDENGEPVPQELGQPEHIKESWKQYLGDPDFGAGEVGDKGLYERLEYDIEIDADAIVPESGIFPVYSVKKARLMNEDVLDGMISYLCKDCGAVWVAPNGEVYSKGCFTTESRHLSGEFTDGEGRLHELTFEIYQGRDMSNDYEYSYWETLCFVHNVSNGYGDGRKIALDMTTDDQNVIGIPDYVIDYFDSGENLHGGLEEFGYDPVYSECVRNETSEEECRKIAEDFIAGIGLSDSMTLGYCGRARLNDLEFGKSCEAMGFAFVPKLGDARTAPVDAAETIYEGQRARVGADLFALWMPNVLKVFVANDTIIFVKWISCTDDDCTGVISRNATLKPFPEIMEIFREKLDLQGNYPQIGKNESEPRERKLGIDRIELCYYRVLAGTGAEEYALIPVWAFIGNVEYGYDKEDSGNARGILSPEGRSVLGGGGFAVMMINALDGSVIDISRGY